MWSSRRLLVCALIGFTALAGCGYTPAFAPGGPAASLPNHIAVAAPKTEDAFDFVLQVEQRLGHADDALYRLSYDISTRQQGVGVTPGQEIIRYNVFGQVNYVLTRLSDSVVVSRGNTDTFTGYSVGSVDVTATPPSTNATISTLAAQRDAHTRLMTALADQVVTRLIASAPDWAQ